MMINKRLIGIVRESKKYIAGNVACQWISLVANIAFMGNITFFLNKLFTCILRSSADSDAFQGGRCAEHNGRPETPIIVS